MAAGLAKSGMLPVLSIYSTFLQRAIDQVIHDIGILNLPVIFGIDRGGLVEDGETHQGVFDISYMRAIPNMRVFAPKDSRELRNMIYTLAKQRSGPAAIRFPRDKALNAEGEMPFEEIDLCKWEILAEGDGPVLLAYGAMVDVVATQISEFKAKGINPTIVNARSAKPLDLAYLDSVLKNSSSKIITVEEGILSGGFGSAVLERAVQLRMEDPQLKCADIYCIAIPDQFVEHGARSILLDNNGLSAAKIVEKVSHISGAQ
jgi:1-deoxy-D-xylulose-5-phosphate synthase